MTALNRSGAGVKTEGETLRLSLVRDALHTRPACEGPARNYAFGARKKKIECLKFKTKGKLSVHLLFFFKGENEFNIYATIKYMNKSDFSWCFFLLCLIMATSSCWLVKQMASVPSSSEKRDLKRGRSETPQALISFLCFLNELTRIP